MGRLVAVIRDGVVAVTDTPLSSLIPMYQLALQSNFRTSPKFQATMDLKENSFTENKLGTETCCYSFECTIQRVRGSVVGMTGYRLDDRGGRSSNPGRVKI
jgi:hypothetical protein